MNSIQTRKPSAVVQSENKINSDFKITASASVFGLDRKDAWNMDSNISIENILSGVDHILQGTGYVKSFDIKTEVVRITNSVRKINSGVNLIVQISLVVEEDPRYMSKAYPLIDNYLGKMLSTIDKGTVMVGTTKIEAVQL